MVVTKKYKKIATRAKFLMVSFLFFSSSFQFSSPNKQEYRTAHPLPGIYCTISWL